jgi:hypothetical protein
VLADLEELDDLRMLQARHPLGVEAAPLLAFGEVAPSSISSATTRWSRTWRAR